MQYSPETKKALEALKAKYRQDEGKLIYAEAEARNPYPVGTIIEDHYHLIQVKSWALYNYFMGDLDIVYSGIQVTKKGAPTKRQIDTTMYLSNVERVIEPKK